MTRPCICDKCEKVYKDGDCRLCWLYHNHVEYKAKWDVCNKKETVKDEKLAYLNCSYRSKLPLDRLGCNCSMKWIYGCKIYGQCTIRDALDDTPTCINCVMCSTDN